MEEVPPLHNRLLDSFGLFLDRVGDIIHTKRTSFLGYRSDIVAQRCKQAINNREWKNYNCNFDPRTGLSQTTISIKKNTIRVSAWVICIGIARFLLQWTRISYAILRTFRTNPNTEWQNRPFTVLQCFGSERLINRETQFWEFIKSKYIDVLQPNACTLIVYGRFPEGPSANGNFFRAKHVLEAVLRMNPPPSTRDLLFLITSQVRSLISFFATLKTFPLVCLLHEDFSLHALMQYLNNRKLIYLWIVDNSSVMQQPLPVTNLPDRHFNTAIVFYSINNKFHLLSDKFSEAVFLAWKYLFLDFGYAWNLDQASWLRKNTGIKFVSISGPMLYRLPPAPRGLNSKVNKKFEVVIFDNTINSAEHYAEIFGKYSAPYNYTTGTMAISFLRDIVGSIASISRLSDAYKFRIRIKVKRRQSSTPSFLQSLLPNQLRGSRNSLDSEYQTVVNNYLLSGRMSNVNTDHDLYDLIGASDLVISIPYTSINFMADQIGVPSIFYDPTGCLVNNFSMLQNMSFIQGRPALEKYLLTALAKWSGLQD